MQERPKKTMLSATVRDIPSTNGINSPSHLSFMVERKIAFIMKFITQHMKQLAMVAYAFALAFTLGGCVNDLTNNEHRAENKETKETFNTKSFAGASS